MEITTPVLIETAIASGTSTARFGLRNIIQTYRWSAANTEKTKDRRKVPGDV